MKTSPPCLCVVCGHLDAVAVLVNGGPDRWCLDCIEASDEGWDAQAQGIILRRQTQGET